MPTAAEGRRKFAARFVGKTNLKESKDNNHVDNNIDNKEANYSCDHNNRKEGRRTRYKRKHHIATNNQVQETLEDETNKESNSAVITTNQHQDKECTSEKLFVVQHVPAAHTTSEQDIKSVETNNMIDSVDNRSKKVNAEDLHLDLSGLEHTKSTRQGCVEKLNKGYIHKTINKQGVNKSKEEIRKIYKGDVNERNEHNINMQDKCMRLECNNTTEEKEHGNNYGDNFNVYSRQLSEETMPSLMRSSQCSGSHGPIITEDWARSVIKPGEEFLLHDVRYPHAIRKNIASDTVGSIRGPKVNQRRQLYTARTAAYEHEMRCHEILYQAAEKEELALLREEQMQKEQELEELEFLERHSSVNTPRSSNRNLRSGDTSSNNINLRNKMQGEQLGESTHIAESAHRKANKLYNKSRTSNVPHTSRLSQTEYVRSLLLSESTRKSTKHNASQSTIRQESRSLNRQSNLLTTNIETNKKEVYTQQIASMMTTDDVECTSHTVSDVLEYTEEAKIESNSDKQQGTKYEECTPQIDSNEYTPDVYSAMPIKPFDSAPRISPRLTESTTITMTIKNAPQTDHITLIDSANNENVEQLTKEKNDINNNNECNSDEEKSLYSMQSYHYSDENRSSKTHPLPNIDKIKENEDMDINRVDDTVNHKFLYTKSQSTMSDDSRNVGQVPMEQMARRSSELSVRPSHNLQMTNKADNTQVYSARQLRTRNTPMFFSRPAYDTTDTKSVGKLNVANNINDDKLPFTPRFQSHSLRNSSEESVTSLLPNTQKKMEPKELEERLLENVKSQNKVNNNYYTKNDNIGNNNEVCTSTAPQENVYSKAINKNADALTENVVVVEYTNDAKNKNAAADGAETKKEESEMSEIIAKEIELLRRARSTLLFRYYNKNNNNKISSNSKTLFGIVDGVMGGNNNKSNKLLQLQQPPILASSILHVKAAGSSSQNKLWRSAQKHSTEQKEEEEFYRSANTNENDTEKIMHDYKSNQQFTEEQTNQKLEKKRPHRPNIALTSVNDLQSTTHVGNVLSFNAIWHDAPEEAIQLNNNNIKNAINVMKMPERTNSKSKDEQKEINYTHKGAFVDSTQVMPTRQVEINEQGEEQSVSLDAALIDMIADPFFEITSDENHCRLLVLNAEYMARNELMRYLSNNHVKNNNDRHLFVTEKTKSSVNSEGCEHYYQTEANTNVNSLFRTSREMEPQPRKPTARVLEMTEEPITHLYTSSSSTTSEIPLLSSHLLPQTQRLSNTSQQIQLAPSLTAMSMERVKPSATITTPRPINLHTHNKNKNKQRKPKSSVDVHIAGATAVHSEKQKEQGATNIAQHDKNRKSESSKSKKTALINKIEHADVHKIKTNLHAPLESEELTGTKIASTPTDDQSKKDDYSNKGSSSIKIQQLISQKVEMENEHKLIKVAGEVESMELTKEKYERSDAPAVLITAKDELQNQEVKSFSEEEQKSLQLQMPIDNNKESLKNIDSTTEEIEKDATKSEDRDDSTVASTRSTMNNEAEISQTTQERYNNANILLKEVSHSQRPEFYENNKRESSLSQQRSVSISSSSQPPSPLSLEHNHLSEVKLIVNAIMPSEKTGPIHSLSTSNIGYKHSSTKISPKLITSQLAHQSIMHESVNCNVDDKSFICEEHDTANTDNHFRNENIMTYYTNEKHDSESKTYQNEDSTSTDVTHNEQEHVYKGIVEEKEEVDVAVMESSSNEDKSSFAPHVNVETLTEASLTNETNVEEENRVLPTLLEVSANENDYSEQESDHSVSVNANESVELASDKLTVEAKDKETSLVQVSNEPRQLYSEPTSTDVTINEETAIHVDSDVNNDIHNKDDMFELESLEKSREYQENINEKSNIEVNAPNAATNLYININDEHGSIVDDAYDNDSDENIIVQPKESVCINNELVDDQEDEDNINNNNNSNYNEIWKNDTLQQTINIDTMEKEQPTSSSDHFQEEYEELQEKDEQEPIDQLRENKASEELFRMEQEYDQEHITNEANKSKLCDEVVRRLVSLLLPTGPVMNLNEEESNDYSTTIATNMKPTRFHDECMEEVKEYILAKYRNTHASSISSNAKDIIGASNVDDTRKNENIGMKIVNKNQSFCTANEMLPDYFQSRSAYIRKLRKELLLDNPNKLTPCASPKAKAPLTFHEIKELSQQVASASPTSSVTTTTTTANLSTLAFTDFGSQNVLLLTVDNDEVSETPVVAVEDEIDDPLDDGSYQQQNVQYVLDLFGNAMQSSNTFCEHTQVTSKYLSPVNIALRHLFDESTRSASTRVIDKSHEHKDITAALEEYSELEEQTCKCEE